MTKVEQQISQIEFVTSIIEAENSLLEQMLNRRADAINRYAKSLTPTSLHRKSIAGKQAEGSPRPWGDGLGPT
jgi:hypothetical protein